MWYIIDEWNDEVLNNEVVGFRNSGLNRPNHETTSNIHTLWPKKCQSSIGNVSVIRRNLLRYGKLVNYLFTWKRILHPASPCGDVTWHPIDAEPAIAEHRGILSLLGGRRTFCKLYVYSYWIRLKIETVQDFWIRYHTAQVHQSSSWSLFHDLELGKHMTVKQFFWA